MLESSDSAVKQISLLIPRIAEIRDEGLKRKTAKVYQELIKSSKWTNPVDLPITSAIKVSGIEHTNAVIEICLRTADTLERIHGIQVNKDYLIASAILHDASKYVEYEPDGEREKRTKLGELGQHTMACVGLMLANEIPIEVVHAVIAHTPQSATVPKTVEAILVYYADSVDYNALRIVHGMSADIKKG